MTDELYIDGLLEKSRIALKEIESFNQKSIDRFVMELAKYVFDNAEDLAKMSVKETRMGSVEYKTAKNKGKARIIWHSLKGKKSIGIINEYKDSGIIEIAKPIGIVGAIQPTTNPQVTPMANAMAAVKGRNSIIIAPHPRAQKTTGYLVDRWNEILKKLGAPDNLIQYVDNASLDRTNLIIKKVDVVVATGGPGMVKAAYSGGKPSFGVGQGNVQTIIDRDVNMKETIQMIVDGRIFDRGIICSGEQTIITPSDKYDEMRSELENYGGFWVDSDDLKNKFINILFPEGKINRDLIGQDVHTIAKAAGIEIPGDTKVIVIPEDTGEKSSMLRREKMFPVITPFKYDKFSDAVAIAIENLEIEGKGHSVSIHSNNKDHIKELGLRVPVSRVLVNQTCATGSGGSFQNGLNPSSTLGCGSWGNNSISENFYYKHLLNITRIAYRLEKFKVPTDEELWTEED